MMAFEEGAALEDAKWQVPAYCFEKKGSAQRPSIKSDLMSRDPENLLHGSLRGSISMSL